MNDEKHQPYDLVVLGGGSAGYSAALRAAQLDMSVAIVEADRLGGTCLHRGCIPTKALLQAGHVADQVRGAERFGVLAELQGLDAAAMHNHKDAVVGRLYKGLQSLVSARSIEVIPGRGRLADAKTVEVNDTALQARHVVVATGSKPRGLPDVTIGGRVLTSDQAMELEWIPRSAIVVGGGVIGVEFASLWRSLGTEVTVVEALPRLLPGEDPTLSNGLRRAFRRRGIEVRTGTGVQSVQDRGNEVTVNLDDDAELTADVLLVAIGRDPVTEGLGLEAVGVDLEGGFAGTDDRLRTGVEGLYAVGDVVRGPQLAHRAFAHGIFVAEEIAGLAPQPVVDSGVPRITYCDPEVAAVGLTEEQAQAEHGADRVRTEEFSLAGNARTLMQGGQGLVKMVRLVDGPIVGVHLIGPGVGELIGEAQLMVGWQAYPEDVAPLVHAHPTMNESLGEAALALAGQPLHSNH